jgi:hypothetical protein
MEGSVEEFEYLHEGTMWIVIWFVPLFSMFSCSIDHIYIFNLCCISKFMMKHYKNQIENLVSIYLLMVSKVHGFPNYITKYMSHANQ